MAEKMLNEKLGEVEYDGLIVGLNPKKRVGPGVIAKGAAETTYVRGTVFAKSAKDGKLYILGSTATSGDTLTADCNGDGGINTHDTVSLLRFLTHKIDTLPENAE